jgi:hypothetical protein
MAEMDNISKQTRVVPRKKVVDQTQADLAKEAKVIGAAVDQFEKGVEAEPVVNVETFSAPPEHTDPAPIFPGSAKAVPSSVRPAVAANPQVFEAPEAPADKRWKYFGYGFLLGSVVIGGVIIFLLTSAYGTSNANLKAKNTQLQSQVESLQKIQKDSANAGSGVFSQQNLSAQY